MGTQPNARKSQAVPARAQARDGHSRRASGGRSASGSLVQHHATGGARSAAAARTYVVVVEKSPRNYGAWVPDLPGCVATAKTKAAVEKLIEEAIGFHLESMREHNERIPTPKTYVKEVDVKIPDRLAS